MTRLILFSLLLVLVCGYALARGGAAERIGALIILLGSVLTPLVTSSGATRFRHVEHGALLVDLIGLVLFFILALTTRRFWPLWMTAMQGVGSISHLAILAPGVIPWMYGNAIALWGYPMLLLLAAATWRHRQRLAERGADSSWARSSSRSSEKGAKPQQRG